MDYIDVRISKDELEAHVRRICRRNLRRPYKICTECPFLPYVLEIMDENDWGYNRRQLKVRPKIDRPDPSYASEFPEPP